MDAFLPAAVVEAMVDRALAEDLGERGDMTTLATVDAHASAAFRIVAREAGVLAGRPFADAVFARIDVDIAVEWQHDDGDELAADAAVARISGPARGILTAERTALNFLGRLSGIATRTRAFVDAVAHTDAVIAHTRKTTPGLRAAELHAVLAGGGARHRFGLDDAVLIKDNHVALAGGVGEAVRRARSAAGHMARVATEIDTLDQLDEAIAAGADAILLDNFSLADLREAVRRSHQHGVVLEASGGVTLETVADIAATGVTVVSVGALTHSAPVLDLGLDAI